MMSLIKSNNLVDDGIVVNKSVDIQATVDILAGYMICKMKFFSTCETFLENVSR